MVISHQIATLKMCQHMHKLCESTGQQWILRGAYMQASENDDDDNDKQASPASALAVVRLNLLRGVLHTKTTENMDRSLQTLEMVPLKP